MQAATEIAAAGRQADVTNDPGLGALMNAYIELPEAIRAGILAMVKAASGSGSHETDASPVVS
jgi:hypothetical protein